REKVPFPVMLNTTDRMRRETIGLLMDKGLSKDFCCAFLLKISNFLVGKFQYHNRHDYQVAFPFALIVDPSNSCPLHCPGCLHNRTFQYKIRPDWPEGNLTPELFSAFISQFGPYASTVLFYNWGEPLLNRHTPDFVRQAKSYLLNTSLSSNLSVQFDAEALVLSGLDYMILSIDGATRASYEHYRRGGRFDLVLDNVKKLVEAKKKHWMATPKLSWQFLVFEHNKHEVEHAKAMAKELGVNDIRFAEPYDVIWEDDLVPGKDASGELYVVGYEQGEEYNRFDMMGNLSSEFARKCDENWSDKLPEGYETMFDKRSGRTCQWLYSSITMDARGRYLPCCYVPRKEAGFSYIFADNERVSGESPYNSELYRFSRKHFVWLSELKKPRGVAPMLPNGQPAPYCVTCPDRFGKPLVNEVHLKRYLQQLDRVGVLSPESLEMIANWDT
ncbi:MAG: radical SAM protein, partial [bacterium]|nr:radical SAM protein [bacterium]